MITAEIFETYISCNKVDAKGRVIGYGVQLWSWEGINYAVVQKGVMVDAHNWVPTGAAQASRSFKTAEAAKEWAYTTAKQRLANLS